MSNEYRVQWQARAVGGQPPWVTLTRQDGLTPYYSANRADAIHVAQHHAKHKRQLTRVVMTGSVAQVIVTYDDNGRELAVPVAQAS